MSTVCLLYTSKAQEIALDYNIIAEPEEKVDVIEELLKEDEEDEKDMVPRPPVVCVMGHLSLIHIWMKKRGVTQGDKAPISVYEVHLGSWKKPDDGREFYNYREIAPMLASYVKELGYTHVELMPVICLLYTSRCV